MRRDDDPVRYQPKFIHLVFIACLIVSLSCSTDIDLVRNPPNSIIEGDSEPGDTALSLLSDGAENNSISEEVQKPLIDNAPYKLVVFSPDDFEMAGIFFGMTYIKLTQLYGIPEESRLDYSHNLEEDILICYYDLGRVYLFLPSIPALPDFDIDTMREVRIIIVNRSGYKGPRGIEVGDSVESVINRFPRDREPRKNEWGNKILYSEGLSSNDYENHCGYINYNDQDEVESIVFKYGLNYNPNEEPVWFTLSVENGLVVSMALSNYNV